MTLHIEPADFADPQLAAFLRAHLDDLEPTAPEESRHALDLAELQRPGVRMWVARAADGAIVGTAALVELTPGHDELKSMRTDPSRRRAGIARQLLDVVLANAADRGVRQISLETGSMTFFAPARALYSSAGFSACPPFGSYRDDPNSTYMTRAI